MLTLKIITPSGLKLDRAVCSLQLQIPDDETGRQGGSLGIHPGHTDALLAVAPGAVTAKTEGPDLTVQVGSGFATVENDVVTLLVDRAEVPKM